MGTTSNDIPPPAPHTASAHWPLAHVLILLGLWLIIFAASLSTPPLLDDADSTHAQAAQAMLLTGDWVTLHVDGIRYLEKPPLPYWITAASLKLFAPRTLPYARSQADERFAAFAVHFPLALTILGLALLGYAWSRRAFPSTNQHAALYTAIFILTSTGVFLFTRIFIPDALLSLLLAFTLYAFLRSLASPMQLSPSAPNAQDLGAPSSRLLLGAKVGSQTAQNSGAPFMRGPIAGGWGAHTLWPYLTWISLALAVLTKGLVAVVFIFGAILLFLFWTNQFHLWWRLRPFTGVLLFLAIAAPWHILAGLRNTGGADGHGFFWFYFINEHVLRFLGRRIPRDYNKLPAALYWSLHLVWLFPWSLFTPAALIYAWRHRTFLRKNRTPLYEEHLSPGDDPPGDDRVPQGFSLGSHRPTRKSGFSRWGMPSFRSVGHLVSEQPTTFTAQTVLILLIFSALVLVFFSISTNQEYYTFPVYLPLLMLLAAALSSIERHPLDLILRRALLFTFAAFTFIGLAIAAALAYGLWSARHLPFVPDIGELLAHRGVGDYTLSMSHFFDLTGPSFAALRLPAILALIAFLLGPSLAWFLHIRRRSLLSILAIAGTSTVFLVAAHIALVRFSPMLSSANFAATIQALERNGRISPNTEVLLFGDQAYGSSIPFYLDHTKGNLVDLVDGRSTSMLFGSTFPDAPPIFLTSADLLAQWGNGPRKILFVPLEKRDTVDQLLGQRQIILQQTSGKTLITDRPLQPAARTP